MIKKEKVELSPAKKLFYYFLIFLFVGLPILTLFQVGIYAYVEANRNKILVQLESKD